MAKILSQRLQEILFSSSDKSESAALAKLLKQGQIRKIAPKIYTSNLEEEPEKIIKRNWFQILSRLFAGAMLSHRSAIELRPTPSGHIFLTYNYTKNHVLPGLTVHLLKGHAPLETDKPFFQEIYTSGEPRAYLENLESSRGPEEITKTLSRKEIEENLEKIIRVRGAEKLNGLRDEAKKIAGILDREKEFKKLNQLISDMLTTGDAKNLQSPLARARILGEPFDPARIDLFEKLYQHLVGQVFPDYPERNISKNAYQNFAFFESYFSNYIEGTEFTLDEAKEIIGTETPIPARDEDSHDILGTYMIVSGKKEMSLAPSKADDLLDLLRRRHRILLSARASKRPGEFKDRNNRAGNTEFVDWQLVSGTLKKGFDWYQLLQDPFAKSIFMMFLISEVHPFLDGNGRVARIMMNAELSRLSLSKIIIPTVYREDYILALKKLTRHQDPDTYTRMMLRAWEFSSNIYGENRDDMETLLNRTEAFLEPKEGKLKMIAVMDIHNQWSDPKPLELEKDVRIGFTGGGGFSVKIWSANGANIEMHVVGQSNEFLVSKNDISFIHNPQISFKTNDGVPDMRISYELI
ncbi:MAG TPA: Fic family protein [Puia sp.]|nr:Fic family protein [Puia sp.]